MELFRSYVGETLSVVGIGRDVDGSSYGVEWGEWDESSAAFLQAPVGGAGMRPDAV